MSREAVRAALATISVWPQTPQVHFIGGEPFLDFPLLLEAVGIAAELGIPCYLETSASWCVDDQLTVARFLALHEAGLPASMFARVLKKKLSATRRMSSPNLLTQLA